MPQGRGARRRKGWGARRRQAADSGSGVCGPDIFQTPRHQNVPCRTASAPELEIPYLSLQISSGEWLLLVGSSPWEHWREIAGRKPEAPGNFVPWLVLCQTGTDGTCFPPGEATATTRTRLAEISERQLLKASILPQIGTVTSTSLWLPRLMVHGFLLPTALFPATDGNSCFHPPKTNS